MVKSESGEENGEVVLKEIVVSRSLQWLFKQNKDTVLLFVVIMLGVAFLFYFQPEHIAQINKGYIEVQNRNEQFQELRDAKVFERLDRIEIELKRLNTSLEKRDESNTRLLESLLDGRK